MFVKFPRKIVTELGIKLSKLNAQKKYKGKFLRSKEQWKYYQKMT